MSKHLVIALITGVVLVIIGLILRYLEQDAAMVFLGLGLLFESYAFMRFAWSNIKRK
ncbi:MAG: hypothetical protein ACPGRE_09350 [Flavobacteriaceae bacterium]